MYYYSPKRDNFYPAEFKQDYIDAGSFPDDVIEVSNDIYQEYAANNAPEGKYRIAGKNGLPEWADIPPPTKEELQQQAKLQKQQLIAEATNQIAPLQDAMDLNMANDEEKAQLVAWKKYQISLSRIDVTSAPDINWPKKP
ncbi:MULTISPECIES: tail fiber assembly protein [Photorhabdus]|uniref:Phage tail protein n=1 Tax=Photorhabdus hindustanensis TaxID=2918802 RepID=A0A2S8PTN0_9GAMM|nr:MULTISPECIES: tail fiber assembly protein [Photorhabdus]MBS9429055.1 tail fiber assembly protein [Photorhabdus akhurstii]PQQ22112.1 phage tail protein [Photorhabdus hindustanensis]